MSVRLLLVPLLREAWVPIWVSITISGRHQHLEDPPHAMIHDARYLL